MSERLVTIATFGEPTEANIVRSRLEADGIRAWLADEATVGVAWHLATAVGGIKLQVAEADVGRAVAVLEASRSASITEDERQSGRGDDHLESGDDEPTEVEAASPSDEMADRALLAALLGLLLFPVQLYSLWLECH